MQTVSTFLIVGILGISAAVACGNGGASSTAGPTAAAGGSGSVSCATTCDDGFACTLDTCRDGTCAHTVGPNSGATACPAGRYCTLEDGCVGAPACATNADCEEAWVDDPCKTSPRCDPASSVCLFDLLDKDGDEHAPQVCGGDDCDDGDGSRFPAAEEMCDGKDNDCDGTVDEQATCPSAAETCESGFCTCPEENFCADGCVDIQTDEANCNGCGLDCPAGTTCEAGRCTCSDPLRCGEVIASSANAWSIAVDSTHVYWGTALFSTDGAHGVYRAPRDGGPVEALVEGLSPVQTIVLDAEYVYFSASFSGSATLSRVAKAGGAPTMLTGGGGTYQLVLTDTHVYFGSPGELARVPLLGGTREAVATGIDLVTGVATDGTMIYWSTVGINGGPTYVHGRPLAGGEDLVLWEGNGSVNTPEFLAVDETHVYWLDSGTGSGNSTIQAVPKSGGGRQSLGGGQGPHGLLVDGGFVYWSIGPACSIARVPAGGGTVEHLVDDACGARGLAVDESYLYWADAERGEIRRVAK